MSVRRAVLLLGVLLISLPLVSGCGYHWGVARQLPEGLRCIRVAPFVDETAEGNLGVELAAAVQRRLRVLDPALLAGSLDEASAVLRGRVRAVRGRTVPMGRGGRIVAGLYRFEIVASARLEMASGHVLKDLGRLAESAEAPVEQGISAAEEARRRALLRATRALGQRIAERLLQAE